MVCSEPEIIHFTPGRIRIKVPSLRGDDAMAEALARKLGRIATVLHTSINTATTSVLVLYDPEAQKSEAAPAAIGKAIGLPVDALPGDPRAWRAKRRESDTRQGPSTMGRLVGDFARSANRSASKLTLGTMDLGFLVPAVLVGMGVQSALRTRPLPLPAWYNHLWFAFGIFRAYNQRHEKQE